VPSPCRECVAQIDCKFAAHHARCWKPEEVAQQAIDLLDACKEYHAQIGDYPAFEFRQMLDTSRDIDVSKYRPPDEVEWARAEQAMINGALQIANSRLRDQGTQRAAGHDELFAGLAKKSNGYAGRTALRAGATTRRVIAATNGHWHGDADG